jgi:ABC-type phosphate transport system substrate-binding protein
VAQPLLQEGDRKHSTGENVTKKKVLPATLAIVAAFAAISPARAENAGLRVIVNARNPLGAMARDEVSKLFMGKNDKWPDGSAAVPVDIAGRTQTRMLFSQEILGKPIVAIENRWQQIIFNGQAVPPPTKSTEQEAVAFVIQNPGAIAYVSYAVELPAGVKELAIR